jgi:tetratricopeptide (TPR) repeat protein
LGNTFVTGDDYHLCLDHLLVNRPSVAHAAELFRIVHRDLYQPLPMVSLQLDFAMYGDGITAGRPWGIHLTNIIIHVLNGALVWVLFMRLTGRRGVAFCVAVMFLAHPLAIESVAWVSGRFMLLCAFFLLLALIAFDKWQLDRSPRRLFWVAVFTVLCMISKVRVELPVLLVILCIVRRLPLRDPRWWSGWLVPGVLTGAFTVFNIYISFAAQVFEESAFETEGPALARGLLSLGWYFTHYVWPSGLSPWYPQPAVVAWSQPEVMLACLAIGVALGFSLWMWRRNQPSALGMIWFLSGVAVMLQFVPNRLSLAADRYAYISFIGLHWMVVSAGFSAAALARRRTGSAWPQGVGAVGALGVLVIWIGAAREHGVHYRDDIAWQQRCLALNPAMRGSRAKLAWAHIRVKDYAAALKAAEQERELPDGDHMVAEEARGWAYFEMGQLDLAERHLREAITFDTGDNETVKAYNRLARVLEAQKRPEEAIASYRRALARMDWYEPTLISLGNLYYQQGRIAEAKGCYEKALQGNPHHVKANNQLGIIEMQSGQLREAVQRYERLLSHVPDFDDARVQYAVCLSRMGRTADAIAQYDYILSRQPDHDAARINRGLLLTSVSDFDRAEADLAYLIEHGDPSSPMIRTARHTLHQLYVRNRQPDRAVTLWQREAARHPGDPELPMWAAWSTALAGRQGDGVTMATEITNRQPGATLARLTIAYVDYRVGNHEQAADGLTAAIAQSPIQPPEAVDEFRDMLLREIQADPEKPWPLYLFGILASATNQPELARESFKSFLNADPPVHYAERAQQKLAELGKAPSPKPAPATSPKG